jgi:hypothetical protein
VDVGWMGGRMWDVEVSTVLLCWSCNDHRPASIGAEVFYLNDNTGDPRLEQTERHNTYTHACHRGSHRCHCRRARMKKRETGDNRMATQRCGQACANG